MLLVVVRPDLGPPVMKRPRSSLDVEFQCSSVLFNAPHCPSLLLTGCGVWVLLSALYCSSLGMEFECSSVLFTVPHFSSLFLTPPHCSSRVRIVLRYIHAFEKMNNSLNNLQIYFENVTLTRWLFFLELYDNNSTCMFCKTKIKNKEK